jgi:hypothetical protein
MRENRAAARTHSQQSRDKDQSHKLVVELRTPELSPAVPNGVSRETGPATVPLGCSDLVRFSFVFVPHVSQSHYPLWEPKNQGKLV